MTTLMAKRKRVPVHPTVKQLRALRERLEMSQQEFAADLNISLSTLRNWEQGWTRPDSTTLAFMKLYLQQKSK